MTDITPIPVLSAEEWDARMKTPIKLHQLSKAQLRALAEMLAKPVAPIPVLGQAEWEALMSPEQILRMFATPPERLTREQMRALGFDPGPPPTDAEMDDVEDTEDDEIGFGKYP